MSDDIKSRLQNDIKGAMRAKDSLKLTTLRMFSAAIKQKEIDEQTTLNDSAVMGIINKMIKQRQDAAKAFTEAKRDELAEKENTEIKLLQVYLPKQMSSDEIAAAIEQAMQQTGANSIKEMGKVMAILKPSLQGKADMGLVSAQVKNKLGS